MYFYSLVLFTVLVDLHVTCCSSAHKVAGQSLAQCASIEVLMSIYWATN